MKILTMFFVVAQVLASVADQEVFFSKDIKNPYFCRAAALPVDHEPPLGLSIYYKRMVLNRGPFVHIIFDNKKDSRVEAYVRCDKTQDGAKLIVSVGQQEYWSATYDYVGVCYPLCTYSPGLLYGACADPKDNPPFDTLSYPFPGQNKWCNVKNTGHGIVQIYLHNNGTIFAEVALDFPSLAKG